MDGPAETRSAAEHGQHPRGTLFIVGLYGLLLVLGWLAVFVFVYLPRGAVGR